MPKVCPHFHLSLQSGSNGTLKRMNRKYTAEEYKHKCDLLRKVYGNPALTTDVIVGFPQEVRRSLKSRAPLSRTFISSRLTSSSIREEKAPAPQRWQARFRSRRRRSAATFCWNWTRDGDRNIWKASSERAGSAHGRRSQRSTASITGRDTRGEYLRVAVLSEENPHESGWCLSPRRGIHGKDCLM